MSRGEIQQTILDVDTLDPSKGRGERLVEVVRRLEDVGSIRELTALLS